MYFTKKKVKFGKFYNIYDNSLYKETTQNTFQGMYSLYNGTDLDSETMAGQYLWKKYYL